MRPYQVWPRSEKDCTRESVNGLSRSKQLISSLSAPLTSSVSREWTRPRSCPQVRPYQVWPRSEKNCTRESVNGLSRSKQLISSLSAHLTSSVSCERTRPRSCPQVRTYQVWPRSEKDCTRESVNGLSRSKQLISSLSAHLTSSVSCERTRPRSCPQVGLYQVWPRSEKDCTRKSINGLSRSKQLISSLSAHLTSSVSRERTRPRSCPQVRPYQVWPRSEKDCTRESINGLSRSKQLISSLSAHLTSSVSRERTRPRSCPQVRPYQVWPRSEKDCTRESVNGDCIN